MGMNDYVRNFGDFFLGERTFHATWFGGQGFECLGQAD